MSVTSREKRLRTEHLPSPSTVESAPFSKASQSTHIAAARMSVWASRIPSAIAGGAIATAATDSSFGELVRSLMPSALAALAKPAADSTAAIVPAGNEAATAALAASVRAIEAMLQQQRATSSLRTMLLIGGGAAAFIALRFCWEEFGWATPTELKEGLALVGEAVRASAAELKDSLLQNFGRVDDQLVGMSASIREVKLALTEEMQSVGAQVESLERRVAPIEADVRRTAHGVDLLCEVVAGLPSMNSSDDLIRRLGSFTGTAIEPRAEPTRAELPAPPAPPARSSEQILAELPAPTRSPFLQSILAQPPSSRV